jgi:alkanesulfonate monooxygenase SsuD/methylene tetrahydromethanopterin reductase-like flavin-dependent oxidoreductase (luciferase family)
MRFGLTLVAQSNADWYEKAQRAEQCGFDVLWTPITSSTSNAPTSRCSMGG